MSTPSPKCTQARAQPSGTAQGSPPDKPVRHNNNAAWDAEREAEQGPWPGPRHHADEVRDSGPLDSLGRAVTAPLLPERGEPEPKRRG